MIPQEDTLTDERRNGRTPEPPTNRTPFGVEVNARTPELPNGRTLLSLQVNAPAPGEAGEQECDPRQIEEQGGGKGNGRRRLRVGRGVRYGQGRGRILVGAYGRDGRVGSGKVRP